MAKIRIRCIYDGTNHVILRELRDLSGEQLEHLKTHILNGTLTDRRLSMYTKSIAPLVRQVYRW